MPEQQEPTHDERLSEVLERMQALDLEVSAHELDEGAASGLRRLQIAYSNLAITLMQAVLREERRRERCLQIADLDKECTDAVFERVRAESRIMCPEDGPFDLRWRCFQASEKRWWDAFEARLKHRSTCSACNAAAAHPERL
jgi:hypothetical protein